MIRQSTSTETAKVLAVYPAIGMVEVEFLNGALRIPIEDVFRLTETGVPVPPGESNSVPGGLPDSPEELLENQTREASQRRESLYWFKKDRHYKATPEELESGTFRCPRCKVTDLKKAQYKRREGRSECLLACPDCLFLIKTCDIMGHEDFKDDSDLGFAPF